MGTRWLLGPAFRERDDPARPAFAARTLPGGLDERAPCPDLHATSDGALLTLCVAFAAPVSAGGGNSTAAQLCQKDNWQILERQDGTTFKNQGDCVSYTAQGGTLVPIPPEVSVSVTSEGGGNCLVTLSAAHFSLFTLYPASVWLYYLGRKSFDWGGNITTDRLGSASVPFGTYYGSPTESVVGTVSGVSSSSVPFTC